jgi:hypothetical protein
VEADGGDHDRFWLYCGDVKQAISTKLSRGTNYRTIDDSLLSKMARQLHLTRAEFLELVDCDMDGPRYIDRLRSNNVDIQATRPPTAVAPPVAKKKGKKRR